MKVNEIKEMVRMVPDYPKKGISFLDITTVLGNARCFKNSIAHMAEKVSHIKIDKIIGLDARGFIFASALSYELGCGLVIARKKGKLPYKTISCSYGLEYGKDELEIHSDSILPGENILIVDDVLATGGTAEAAMKLTNGLEGNLTGLLFFAEIEKLNGRAKFNGGKIESLLKF